MAELTLAQSFTLIALNAQRSLEMTVAKKAALRCAAASVVLEACLDRAVIPENNRLVYTPDLDSWLDAEPYRREVFQHLLPRGEQAGLSWCLKRSSSLSAGKLKKLEQKLAGALSKLGLLEEIPALLGSDLYFHSAGVAIKEYRSESRSFSGISEFIRTEILEEGPAAEETLCMLWLLRESGCMHDFFSLNELEQVTEKMGELYQTDPLAKQLYSVRIRRGIELAYRQFLRFRTRVIKTQTASGINFLFPVLERSSSVFIDTETMFASPEQRLIGVKERLSSQGHEFTVLREGQIPLLKIDNIVYEAVPHATYGRTPIHGVRLLPRRPL